PLDVTTAFINNFPILMDNAGISLLEAFLGILISIIFSFLISVLMDRFRLLYKSFYPVLIITQTIPTIAIAPLLVLWMGYGIAPKVALIVLVCFFPIAVSMLRRA
ncbi:MAG: ABC transporter permease, partial [Firmicutes bacterium]|nr:ABC transporter permease [Bacillota bacterium]